MKQLLILYFSIGFAQLLQGQIFFKKGSIKAIGIGATTDISKPFDFKYTHLSSDKLLGFQIKLALGSYTKEVKYNLGTGNTVYLGAGEYFKTKKLRFINIEPAYVLTIRRINHFRNFLIISAPIALSKLTTIDRFDRDLVYGNQVFTYVENGIDRSLSLKLEYNVAVSLGPKSYLDLGFSFAYPIIYQRLFAEASPKNWNLNYVPGIGLFPFAGLQVGYNYCFNR